MAFTSYEAATMRLPVLGGCWMGQRSFDLRRLRQAEDTGAAARATPYNPRPKVGVKRVLQDRLSRETCQPQTLSRVL